MVDYSLLGADVMSALAGVQCCEVDDGVEEELDIDVSSSLVDVYVNNGIGSTITKVNKVIIHKSASKNITLNGTEKMRSMNLPDIRHRRYVRLVR